MKFRRYLSILFSLIMVVISSNVAVAMFATMVKETIQFFLFALIITVVNWIIIGIIATAGFRAFPEEERLEIFWFSLVISAAGAYLTPFLFSFLRSFGHNINMFTLIVILIANGANLNRSPIKPKGGKNEQKKV